VFADFKYKTDAEYLQSFKEKLIHITNLVEVPMLSEYGLREESIPVIVKDTSHKYHPIKLSESQMGEILQSRI
jgi:alcohol dehydrogenase class IV